MDKKPVTYTATFFLGASLMRIVGFMLGYGNFEDTNVMFDAGKALSVAITVGILSAAVLVYCTYRALPCVHVTVRKIISHLAASGLAVCLWRLYAQHLGSHIPGLIYANSRALVVSGAFVCTIVLVLMIFYGEDEEGV